MWRRQATRSRRRFFNGGNNMTREKRDTITVWSAVAMLFFGCTLTTIAFFVNPLGEIHDSVLWVLGQCFLYAGAALGIAAYAKTTAMHEVDERFKEYERRHRFPQQMDDYGTAPSDYDKTVDDGED